MKFMDLGMAISFSGVVSFKTAEEVRTRWTLESDLVWEKTQRLGGKLLAGVGVVTAGAALLLPPLWAVAAALAGCLTAAAVSIAYARHLGLEEQARSQKEE